MGRHRTVNVEALRAYAARGMTLPQIAIELGVQYQLARLYARRYDIDVVQGHHGARGKPLQERAERMAGLFRQGMTLQAIADEVGITRERVRQILKSIGIARGEGGWLLHSDSRREVQAQKFAAQQARCEANCLARWGLGREEMAAHRASGSVQAFTQQRSNARHRGIPWSLTFVEWLSVWESSGHFAERGRGKGYVMSRNGDTGAYEIGNVAIKLAAENSREAVKLWCGKVKANRGVHHAYPGTAKPFVVKVCRKQIGRFVTEAEAAQARCDYINSNGMALRPNGQAFRIAEAA